MSCHQSTFIHPIQPNPFKFLLSFIPNAQPDGSDDGFTDFLPTGTGPRQGPHRSPHWQTSADTVFTDDRVLPWDRETALQRPVALTVAANGAEPARITHHHYAPGVGIGGVDGADGGPGHCTATQSWSRLQSSFRVRAFAFAGRVERITVPHNEVDGAPREASAHYDTVSRVLTVAVSFSFSLSLSLSLSCPEKEIYVSAARSPTNTTEPILAHSIVLSLQMRI